MRFTVSRVMDVIERRLTTDVTLAQAVVDLGEVARYSALDGGRQINLVRIGMVIDALGRYLVDEGAMLYAVAGRELLSEGAFTSKERMVLSRWADDGLIEVIQSVGDRVVEVADFTGVPLIVVRSYDAYASRFPWLRDAPERSLWLRPRAGRAVLTPGVEESTGVPAVVVGKASIKPPPAPGNPASAKATPEAPASGTPAPGGTASEEPAPGGTASETPAPGRTASEPPAPGEPGSGEPASGAEASAAESGSAASGPAGPGSVRPEASAEGDAAARDATETGATETGATETGAAEGGAAEAEALETKAPETKATVETRRDDTAEEAASGAAKRLGPLAKLGAVATFRTRGAVRVSSTRVVDRRFLRTEPSGVGVALLTHEWRCLEPGCPAFGGYRRIGQPVPTMRRNVPSCPRHDRPLSNIGPRPASYAITIVVDDLAKRRFAVDRSRPVVVGRAPSAPEDVSVAEWLHSAAASWIAPAHLRLRVGDGDGALTVTDTSENGTLVWRRSGPDDPGRTERLYGTEYRMGDWDSIELYTGVELVPGNRHRATAVGNGDLGSVLVDAPTVVMQRSEFSG